MKKTTLLTLVFSSCIGLYAQSNLIAGGDFDIVNQHNNRLPDLWNFYGLDIQLIESVSYPNNKGWRYVDVTAKVGGKMMNYRVNEEMKIRYNCIRATSIAKYVITFWAKSKENNAIKIHIPWYDANGKSSKSWTSPAIQLDGGVWKRYTLYTDAAPSGIVSNLTAVAGLEVWFDTSNGIISFDDFSVTADTENHQAGDIIVEEDKDGQTPETPIVTSDNLFRYGNFEEVNPSYKTPMGWYLQNATDIQLSDEVPTGSTGRQSLCVLPTSNTSITTHVNGVTNILNVNQGETYVLSLWAKGKSAKDKFSARFSWYGNNDTVDDPEYIAKEEGFKQDWALHTYEVKIPAGVNSASFVITFSTGNDYVYFDDISLTKKMKSTGISEQGIKNAQFSIGWGKLSVNVKEPAKVLVLDVSGKIVYAATVKDKSIISLNKGSYLVKINNRIHKVVI